MAGLGCLLGGEVGRFLMDTLNPIDKCWEGDQGRDFCRFSYSCEVIVRFTAPANLSYHSTWKISPFRKEYIQVRLQFSAAPPIHQFTSPWEQAPDSQPQEQA